MAKAQMQREEEIILGAEKVPGSGEVKSGYISRLNGPPVLVDYEVINGQAVFEGDIILGPADTLEPGQPQTEGITITGDRFRWHNGIVPFTIDAGLTNQARVTGAIQHWEQNTSIRFVQRSPRCQRAESWGW